MDDYVAIFSQRATEYNEACQRYPYARKKERQILIDWLDIGPNQIICDWPAGGGYLAEGLAEHIDGTSVLICAEPVWEFAREIPQKFNRAIAAFHCLSFKSNSIDRVGSLAGLHHEENKEIFFEEVFRILRPGGILVVADVMVDTPTAIFLNGPVDQLSTTGHKGMFIKRGEFASYLRKAGFSSIEEKYHSFTWDFPDWEALLLFSRKLFGLAKPSDEQIRKELKKYFEIKTDKDGVHLPWSLIYGKGIRPKENH
jgi:SAM-dependent methyltransferase